MASFWDLLRATWPAQAVDPYVQFAPTSAVDGNSLRPGVASVDSLSRSTNADEQAQASPIAFWHLLPAAQSRQPLGSITPGQNQRGLDPWLVGTPEVSNNKSDSSIAAQIMRDDNELSENPAKPPTSFWDLLPATPHGQPVVPMMSPAKSIDTPFSPAISTAPTVANAPVPTTSAQAPPAAGNPALSDAPTTMDKLAYLAKRVYLPLAIKQDIARLPEYVRDLDEMGRLLTTPPPSPPADSQLGDDGSIWVERNGKSDLWQNVDLAAASAYYREMQLRAELAPRIALMMIGGGSGFAPRGAAGIAGGRLSRPPTTAANIGSRVKRADSAVPSSAAPAANATTSTSSDAAVAARQASSVTSDPVSVPASPPEDGLAARPLARLMLTGQNHHAISKRIHDALEKSSLAGVYNYRDARFMTRAVDSDAHRGYQTWHRNLDNQINEYVRCNAKLTRNQFEDYLRERYAQPDLLQRFPNGL